MPRTNPEELASTEGAASVESPTAAKPAKRSKQSRTRVAAPKFSGAAEAAEVVQQGSIDLNPGARRQEAQEQVESYSPQNIETEAFYNQLVGVYLMEDANEGAGDGVVMNVNGEDCYVPAGRLVHIKRKFVAHLCEMRETKFVQPPRDQFRVESGNKLIPKSQLLYPFTVQQDPHPHGGEWLRRNLQRTAMIASGLRYNG